VPQGPELLVILLVVLLIFGGAKIPQLARSLGQAQREFRRGASEPEGEGTTKDSKPST
jgi:sec-independent protein translocase protein TatA